MCNRKPFCGRSGALFQRACKVGYGVLIVGTLLLSVGCDEEKATPATEEASASPVKEAKKEKELKGLATHGDWCIEHQVPESMCAKCNPGLEEKLKASGDWCKEHGHAESVCPVCNPATPPEDAHARGDWCVEHGLPESKCTKCNTELVDEYKASGDWCEAHGFPESVCPSCNPQKPPAGAERAAIEARTIRFRTPNLEKISGIAAVKAQTVQAEAAVTCAARIEFDADRVADVRSTTPGIVRALHVSLGASVKKGTPLFELESSHVGEIQGSLAIALEEQRIAELNLKRKRTLLVDGATAQRDVELAEQSLAVAKAKARAAQATLRIAGAPGSGSSGRYTLYSPISGVVVRRPALLGLLATEGTSLATVGNASVMWALCEVPESDASRIALGQETRVVTNDGVELSSTGKLTWIASEVNPRTRTVTARSEIPNPDGRLRANQFAQVSIETGAPRRAIAVPHVAIQRIGELEVVFVRAEAGVYEPRVVKRVGAKGDSTFVEGRLEAGEEVVTTGAVLLRTESVPGSIGAGCCEIEGPGEE